MDVHDKATRSYNMSMIKGSNTKPELIIRKYLHRKGFRYTLNNNKLPGKPDIVFKKYSTVIFVHGCFWHAHENCKYYKQPKTNTSFWINKLSNNIARDKKHARELLDRGWNVITVWECETRDKSHITQTLNAILIFLRKQGAKNRI